MRKLTDKDVEALTALLRILGVMAKASLAAGVPQADVKKAFTHLTDGLFGLAALAFGEEKAEIALRCVSRFTPEERKAYDLDRERRDGFQGSWEWRK